MANRLSKETSPYLLQHQNNPVDWYPWSEESLAKARAENKPILLSIGYSACHWCHVMEHESFEDAETAKLMNDNFVNIKVDREERPDLDQIYQNVAQAMTQGGGWPLTVFLTSELKPFYGGTYFPPEDRYGRPGFKRLLKALSEVYKNDYNTVAQNAEKLTQFIRESEALSPQEVSFDSKSLGKIAEQILSYVDWDNGGFGHAPKFPNAMLLTFLWRFGLSNQNEQCKKAVLLSLTRMTSGGIYDHLGGGFHRYSVDHSWSVPHFEKMLYDNALLLKLYSEVLLSGQDFLTPEQAELYVRTIEETGEYIHREMLSPQGVFYTAQDADSEGHEGKFFVWNPEELRKALTSEQALVFERRYGVTPTGNFENGDTVLYINEDLSTIAQHLKMSDAAVESLLKESREILLKARSQRVAPGLDSKVLTSWNGLMISGLSWAAQALKQYGKNEVGNRFLHSAQGAYEFLNRNVRKEADRLFSTFQGGKGKGNGYLDDYAFMAQAALDLARFCQDSSQIEKFIDAAEKWIHVVLTNFADPEGAGYFFTSDDHEVLVQRPKTLFDQAIPSGTAVILTTLMALVELESSGSVQRLEDEIEKQFRKLFSYAEQNPYGSGELLCSALLNLLGPVAVSGKLAAEVCIHPHVFQKARIDSMRNNENLVCHKKVCSIPIQDLKTLRKDILNRLHI